MEGRKEGRKEGVGEVIGLGWVGVVGDMEGWSWLV